MPNVSIYRSHARLCLPGCGLLLLLAMTTATAASVSAVKRNVDVQQIQTSYAALARLQRQLAGLSVAQRLERINRFFNQFRADTDQHVWGQAEFWATPRELFTAMAGDCEDIAVAKYFTLINSGIDEHRLRLAHVKAYNSVDMAIEEHLVLFYLDDRQQVYVLDNLTDAIKPFQGRQDLLLLYSFNRYGVWNSSDHAIASIHANSRVLANWRNMLARLQSP